MANDVLATAKEKMAKTQSVLQKELSSLRAGRANPQLLDRITVDYYGTPTPLTQIGNISAPEPRMLVISLWDTSMISAVEKAINASDLGIHPSNDGKVIRLVVPELTEERRKDLVKEVKKKGEAGKVAIRNIRRDANDYLKKLGKTEVSEDEISDLEDAIQKMTDKYIKDIDKATEEKSKEILTV